MLTLGIEGDAPPNDLQPPVRDGMHLRWAFDPAKGFPWHGYYLFRRRSSLERDEHCLRRSLRGHERDDLPPPAPALSTGFGVLTSDQPLVFTDDFPPPGTAEVDLANRAHLRFDLTAGTLGARAEVTIGFRERSELHRHCVSFERDEPGEVDNPLARGGIELEAADGDGSLRPTGRVMRIGDSIGWDTGFHALIVLPCEAEFVTLTMETGAMEAKLEAVDANGDVVATAAVSGPGPEQIELHGDGSRIVAVRIDAPSDETIVTEVCWRCTDGKDGDDEPRDLETPHQLRRPEREMTLDALLRERIRRAAVTPGRRWLARTKALNVRLLLGGQVMAQASVTGGPGDFVTATLAADGFDAVELDGHPDAALIDLCVEDTRSGIGGGWEEIKGFQYPLCLPVAHADYPCAGAPTTEPDAEALALDRITYGQAATWAGSPFASLHDRLERLVVGGPPPGGQAMADRHDAVTGSPAPPASTGGAVVQDQQRPLDLVLLASLQPACAQMIGLAFCDETAAPGEHYDYLLLADHDNSLGGSASDALDWIATVADFSVVDGFIACDKVVTAAVPLLAPAQPKVYALPGATIAAAGGGVLDASNNAGLVWDRAEAGDSLSVGAPIMYHVWCASLGDVVTPPTPADEAFVPLTRDSPLPVTRPVSAATQVPVWPREFPPFPLYYVDRARSDGWYAYRVSSVDIFGRHSLSSSSAAWRQWAPMPSPRPWYYVDPPGDQVIHGAAIRLLDKIPPPPPTGVEAFALDPDDPTVLHDAAWQAWRASLTAAERASLVGLRVRWRWNVAQQEQAPDTREFRVYYQDGPVNAWRGEVTSVASGSATESDVLTTIANTRGANAYVGWWLRVGAQSFKITSSQAGTPLRVRVKNLGASGAIAPARTRCSLTIPPADVAYVDYGPANRWARRAITVPYASHVTVAPNGDRFYEVLLPVAGSADRTGAPLVTTVEEPLATAIVGVTAADDKQHTADHRGEAARYGNESPPGGPATVLRVRRTPPDPPAVPPDSGRLYASLADYHHRSYFTYRWLPAAHLRTHVFRALDDAVFRADLARRPRPPLAGSDATAFPPDWAQAKRDQVATELNALNALNPADWSAAQPVYASLSNDGLRILAGLPGIARAFMQVTQNPLGPAESDAGAPGGLRWRRVGPDVAPGSLAATQRAFVDTLDGRATNRWFYRCAYVDAVHNVSALSLSSPPVWLPNVTPPRAPVVSRIKGGDRKITIEWASNREPDLAAYRVYRTDDPRAARDLRLMTLVHTVAVAQSPSVRPATVSLDDIVPGLVTFSYRIVAVDDAGNVSDPCPTVTGRGFDQALPVLPALTVGWDTAAANTRAQLSWTSTDEVLVQRSVDGGATWVDLTSWRAPGTVTIRDPFSDPGQAQDYRLWARKYTGAVAKGALQHLAAM